MTSNPDKNLDSFLHYGCLITLSYNKSYAHSVGFIDDSVYVNKPEDIEDFSQAVFRVLPQCMNTVQNSLITNTGKETNEDFKKLFQSQESNLKEELKDNLETYEKFKGQFIRFGSIVYLQHVQSHRFLTVIPEEVSTADKDSLRVCLTNFPNDNSYIRLESSYNFQKEGKGLIRKIDMVILEISLKTKSVNISVSEALVKAYSGKLKSRLLSGCLDKRPKWQINLYLPVNFENSKLISCSDYIWISHSEGKAVLVGNKKETYSLVYFDTNMNNCNGIWEVENKDFTKSSLVYSDEVYRIKHLSSSLYLSLVENEDHSHKAVLVEKNFDGNLWKFEQVHSKKANSKILSEQFYSLVNDKYKIKLQALDSLEPPNCILLGFKDDSSESSYLKIFKVESNTLWESQFTKSCIPFLNSLKPFISKYKASKNQNHYTMIKMFNRKMEITEKCLKNIKNFVQNKLQSSVNIGKYYGVVDAARQKLLKELGIIDILAKVLQSTFVDEFSINKLLWLQKDSELRGDEIYNENNEKVDALKEYQLILLRSLTNMTNIIYKVITVTCYDNLENQLYVYKFFEIFQSHSGYNLGATKCLSSLLSNNQNLLYKLSRNTSLNIFVKQSSIIDHYIWLLKKFHKDRRPHLVEFLKVVCICGEMGVAANQEKVHEKMFYFPDSYNKVIIPVTIDNEKSLKILLRHPTGVGEEYIDFFSFFDNGTIIKSTEEIIYFTKLIGVFSSLCKSRNYVCKSSISNWFPLPFLLESIWNENLEIEIRANFLELLMSMHIDFLPRYYIEKPELIRTADSKKDHLYRVIFHERHSFLNIENGLEMMKKVRQSINERKKIPKSSQSNFFHVQEEEFEMFHLKNKLIEELGKTKPGDFNCFTLQLLKLASLLIQFEVITLEISDLDSRKCEFGLSNDVSPDKIDIYRLLIAIQKLFDEVNEEKTISQLSKSYGIIMENQASSKKFNFEISEEPFANYLEGIQKYLEFQSLRISKQSKKSMFDIECKLEFCKIIQMCLNMRHEFILEKFLASYDIEESSIHQLCEFLKLNLRSVQRLNNKHKNSIEWQQILFDPFSFSKADITSYILRMFNSTINYKLKSELLGIILKYYSQTRTLIKNIKKVKIMTMENDPDIVLWSKINIETLKNLSEQSEIICKFWISNKNIAEKNIEKLTSLFELLKNFELVLFSDCRLEDENLVSNSIKIEADRQIMLRDLNFHVFVSNIINDCMYILEDIYENPGITSDKEVKEKILNLLRQCFKCLRLFTYSNPGNQKTLYPLIHIFTINLRIQIGQIELLCEIFRDNVELCELINENFLKKFIDLIQTEGRQADFLNFFEVVTVVMGSGIPNNQRMVLKLLTDSEVKSQVCYMKNNRFYFDSEDKDSSKLAQNSLYKDQPFAYHARLISVLTKCGSSTTTYQLIKSKCQKIIPLDQIFDLLSKTGEFIHLELYLLEFLIQIYLSTSQKNEDFDTFSLELSKVLDIKKQQLDQATEKSFNKQTLEKWVEFLGLYYENYILKGENALVKVKIHEYINTVTKIWESLKQYKFSPVFKSKLTFLCSKYDAECPASILTEEEHDYRKDTIEKEKNYDKLIKDLENPLVKSIIKQERNEFLESIAQIQSKNTSSQEILESLIEFISKANVFKPPLTVLYAVIKFLAEYIPNISASDKTLIQKRKEIQDNFKSLKIVPIVLQLMCDKDLDRNIFSILVSFAVKLLEGGNSSIQYDFYCYFSIFPSSEHFFYTLHSIILDHISLFAVIKESDSLNKSAFKKSNKIVNNIIKLLQLFCENHFEPLQNYIRVQDKSHNNHDLVVIVITLLHELMRSRRKEDFFIISHCFEMLTECIQGPCRQNQKAIINSKFLEIAGELLSIDEKNEALEVFEDIKDKNKEAEVNSPGFIVDYSIWLAGWMISHLKYKCMITLMGLLEGRIDSYILVRMARTFNLQIFRQNIISIYENYTENFKNIKYSKELFNHFIKNNSYDFNNDKNEQDQDPQKFTFIIEVGFLIYFLLKYFINIEDPEIKKLLENDIPEFVKLVQKLKEDYSKSETLGKLDPENLVDPQMASNSLLVAKALVFFERNTANVEVVFQGVLCVTYFWIPPVCHHLTYETQEEFHSRVDRSSDKKKVEYLVSRASEVIEDMSYEEWLSTVYGYKLIGQHVRKVKFVAFLLSIVLNILILLSYNSFQGDRFYKPSLGRFEVRSKEEWNIEKTQNVILGLGIIQAILSGLIFFFFIIKTAPILIQRLWKRQDLKNLENLMKPPSSSVTQKFMQTVLYTLINFDVLYHFFYFSFSILAITLHPFFYSAHLLDIMYRFPSLQGVVKSIIVPWRALLLTLVFIIVVVYLFSVWAYFRLHYTFEDLCDSLFICFITVFDKGIKNYGGVGLWLDYKHFLPKLDTVDIERFFFDNIYVVIIWYIMLNIVQGIIYVTFAIVRETDAINLNDYKNVCFICGKEKEIVERLTERPFNYHRIVEHNEWNYIFFIAYLKFKETTEHSGIESYVFALNIENKIDWIPQQQCISFQIKEKFEEDLVKQGIQNAQDIIQKLQRILKYMKIG